MGEEEKNLDLKEAPSNGVSLLIQRIRRLQREKERAVKGESSLFLSSQRVRENIRSFLEGLDIDDEWLSVTESEDVESIVATLFVVIRSLQHEIECRNRDQKRLVADVEVSQKIVRRLRQEKQTLERENTDLGVRLEALEGDLKRMRKRQ